VDPSTVRRLNQRLGEHGQRFHNDQAQALCVEAIEADERHGYATHKGQPAWEAELMDPVSKFVISHVQGKRNEALIRTLLEDGAARLAQRQDLVLLTDGEASYATRFPEIFGQPYRPSRTSHRGRPPKLRFRIPRSLAHWQIVKHRTGSRMTHIEIRHRVPPGRGSQKRVTQALEKLGYQVANTSAIERRNGTARTMSAHQVRKALAFSRRTDTKQALGWWSVTVYNWCRPHRSLRQPLTPPLAKKSISSAHRRWR
jgi:IS1 family transposase